MHIKKCFGEITEQSGGEFKISTEKDNKNTKKLRSIMRRFPVRVPLDILAAFLASVNSLASLLKFRSASHLSL